MTEWHLGQTPFSRLPSGCSDIDHQLKWKQPALAGKRFARLQQPKGYSPPEFNPAPQNSLKTQPSQTRQPPQTQAALPACLPRTPDRPGAAPLPAGPVPRHHPAAHRRSGSGRSCSPGPPAPGSAEPSATHGLSIPRMSSRALTLTRTNSSQAPARGVWSFGARRPLGPLPALE